MILLLNGCAVHFSNPKTGMEQIWGLGKLRMQTESCGNSMTAATSGMLVPGPCIDISPTQFGIGIGLVQHQQIIAFSGESPELKLPQARGLVLHRGAGELWSWGFASLRTAPRNDVHNLLVTQKKSLGLRTEAGRHPSIQIGLHTVQRLILGDNVSLTLVSTNSTAGSDLFAWHVIASTNVSEITVNTL